MGTGEVSRYLLAMFCGRRRGAAWIFSMLAFALIGYLPSSATAVTTYFVNGTGDQADVGVGVDGCKTSVNSCTLRAAIEESNASVHSRDRIGFSVAFDGEMADMVQLSGQLPPITDPVTIDGGNGFGPCLTDVTVLGPCAGVDGVSGEDAFRVEAEGVEIKNLSITGARIAINAVGGAHLWLQGDWIGVRLDDSAGSNETGILLDRHSDMATIGGSYGMRMVFGNNAKEALDLEGTDGVSVASSYFGTNSYGLFAAPNGKNIEITDVVAGADAEATGNAIGAWVASMPKTTECDVFCNVISGSLSAGIDLAGDDPDEAAASGPTEIVGNYIGYEALGAEVIGNATAGVLVGGADDVTIGTRDAGSGNLINGGMIGVSSGPGAEGLEIVGNVVGLDPAAAETSAPPSSIGLSVDSGGAAGPFEPEGAASIEFNRISMEKGVAIGQQGNGAVIDENLIGQTAGGAFISGGDTGISVLGDGELGNLIRNNQIANTAGDGILVSNSHNVIKRNAIVNAGAAGIRIKAEPSLEPTGNYIGGLDGESANWIVGSGGDAIEITAPTETDNEVGGNFGEENAGEFIDLGGDGAGNSEAGPNRGIQAPIVSSANSSQLVGSAIPGATVQVFSKNTPINGEIGGFVGETEANASGNWALNVSGYRYYGATQIYHDIIPSAGGLSGTSEMVVVDTAPPPSNGGESPKVVCPRASGCARPARLFPQTVITEGPRKTTASIVRFVFRSTMSGSRFRCKLDKKPFLDCRSPRFYRGVQRGMHLFKVRAVAPGGVRDRTPAIRKFTILD